MCIVERIEKTVVFVKILNNGNETEGSITTSEIAPGRIRNIRDYVVPKKKNLGKKEKKEEKKITQEEFEKKIIELCKKGLTSEKIGENLRKEGIHPKNYQKKISKVLKVRTMLSSFCLTIRLSARSSQIV